jgi:uncharacterized protein
MNQPLLVTERTTPHRYPERMRTDRALLWQIIDEALLCHLAFVVDGSPRVLPVVHARIGDTLYLHGSTGSGSMLAARSGLDVCVAISLIDELVFAPSQAHHSMNYRSVVAHGRTTLVADPAVKRAALAALVDHVAPGRAADSRPPTNKELAQVAVLALPLDEASVKVRAAGPTTDELDDGLPHWAGVLPLRLDAGAPMPLDASRSLPDYLLGWRR